MESAIATLKDTPIPTILVIAGIAFLLLAIAGQLAGRIAVAPERQRWAAVIGGVLLTAGVVLYVVPQARLTSPVPHGGTASQPSSSNPPPPPSMAQPEKPPPSPPEPPGQGLTERTESSPTISTAKLIDEGTTVRGSIVAGQDQHFFKFNSSSTKTRVILRKLSKSGFQAAVDIYDHNEKGVAGEHEGVSLLAGMYPQNQPITLSFESNPGELYYIAVTALASNARDDYELTVRKE